MTKPDGKHSAKSKRKERLGDALRANLKRRKMQARERDAQCEPREVGDASAAESDL